MITIKHLVLEALEKTGEKPDNLVCFYQEAEGHDWAEWLSGGPVDPKTIHRCSFSELPEREYSDSFGGPDGPAFIGFSDRYVYISEQYDGTESVQPIPRNPEDVGAFIPWPGG